MRCTQSARQKQGCWRVTTFCCCSAIPAVILSTRQVVTISADVLSSCFNSFESLHKSSATPVSMPWLVGVTVSRSRHFVAKPSLQSLQEASSSRDCAVPPRGRFPQESLHALHCAAQELGQHSATNTAVLLLLLGADLYCCGLAEHEERLQALLRRAQARLPAAVEGLLPASFREDVAQGRCGRHCRDVPFAGSAAGCCHGARRGRSCGQYNELDGVGCCVVTYMQDARAGPKWEFQQSAAPIETPINYEPCYQDS